MFDLSGAFAKKEIKTEEKKSNPRSVIMARQTKNTYRRAFSETQLLDLVDNFQEGYQYNFITGGDVDALSYLKLILRHQKLDHLILSTWCMAVEDIYQIRDYLKNGQIKKIDAYVGEIFPSTYRKEYELLKTVITRDYGKIVVFRNHSKIFAGYGDKFHFGIQTSANINTNPRTENGCITIDKAMYEFYLSYYDGVKSIAGQ